LPCATAVIARKPSRLRASGREQPPCARPSARATLGGRATGRDRCGSVALAGLNPVAPAVSAPAMSRARSPDRDKGSARPRRDGRPSESSGLAVSCQGLGVVAALRGMAADTRCGPAATAAMDSC
jgi:hypothetical protein